MSQPFFSIIIPLYNRSNRIVKTLDSLSNQTFNDFETIVIDDCSTDNSFKIASNHPLKNKTVLRNDENLERCLTRNKGILKSKGLYICFIDSDDYHLPNHLERLKDLISESKIKKAFFFTNSFDETEEGVRTKRICPQIKHKNIFTYLMRYTINPQRWAVHSEIIKTCLFDENINICEDLDVSLRIASKGVPFIQLMEHTTVYVHASDSFTSSDPNKNEREYNCYKKIFSRPELQNVLPRKNKNRLLSKCHYFFALRANKEKNKFKTIKHVLFSFFLYPKGYNGKTNKTLLILFVYNFPIIGIITQKSIQSLKRV